MLETISQITASFLSNYIYVLLLIGFVVAYISVPPIILASKKMKLGDKGGGRKIHKKVIPSLGGIAIILSFITSLIIWAPNFRFSQDLKGNVFVFGGGSVLILLILGVRDDIIPMRSYVKLIGQILTAFIVVVFGKLYFTDLDGLLGIHEIPVFYAQVLSITIIVAIINAYNLIDGIDGLASSLTIVSAAFFGVWFLLGNNIVMFTIAFSLMGALFGFLMFNKSPAKIFMGDTGSMFIGFILSILAIRFIDFNNVVVNEFYHLEHGPLIAMTAMLVPLADVTRVFVDRIIKGNSPFKPDKTHIHHLLLKLGFTHNMVVSLLVFVSITFIFISLALNRNFAVVTFLSTTVLFIALSIMIKYLIRDKIKKIRKA